MYLNKVEKATLVTALSIFKHHISSLDNEVSNSDPFATLMALTTIKILTAKLDLVDMWMEINEYVEQTKNEEN